MAQQKKNDEPRTMSDLASILEVIGPLYDSVIDKAKCSQAPSAPPKPNTDRISSPLEAVDAMHLAMEHVKRVDVHPQDARALWNHVGPHIQRTVRLRELLFLSAQRRQHYAQALEVAPFGVVFLARNAKVAYANGYAEQAFVRGNQISLHRGELQATNADNQRLLRSLVDRFSSASPGKNARAVTIRLRRVNASSALLISALPAAKALPLCNVSRPAALLLIVDPDLMPGPRCEFIRHALQLTRAEAQLAGALLEGISLREVASRFHRSINTCKAQLKSIYAKAGCRSRAELAKTLIVVALAEGGLDTSALRHSSERMSRASHPSM